MTTQPDIDAIAREAALEAARVSGVPCNAIALTAVIAVAIRRALEPLVQENKDMAKAMALKTKLEHHLSEALSERDAAVNGMLDLKRTNQMLAEQLLKHAETIEVLKDVEFSSGACPLCHGTIGHHDDCKLAKAIGK